MVTLGFVGLGEMGGSMADHLADRWEVVCYDRVPEAVADREAAGATGLDSAAEVGAVADVVFLSLPGPGAVRSVVADLEPELEAGDVLVDTTTSTPRTTREITERLGPDVGVLGAPVSGGSAGAAEGTLTVMVGGDGEALASCREYIEAFASTVRHVGEDPGHGHAMKLLNNYLSFVAMVATSEAMTLGQEAGLDIETMAEVFSESSGRNSATEDKFPAIARGEEVGFSLDLMAKDARLLSAFADDHDLALPLAGIVRSEVDRARVRIGSDGDMTAIYEYVRDVTVGDADRSETDGSPLTD